VRETSSLRVRTPVLAGTIGAAGCIGDDGAESPTATPQRTDEATPTQAQNLGTIEYTVTNADDETHRLSVTMENAEGTVIQETNEPEFQPDASVSSGDPGHDPDAGPFTLTFSTDSASETYEWDVRECARIDLSVTITSDGSITVERVLCQN
jgi:hypothetical protein